MSLYREVGIKCSVIQDSKKRMQCLCTWKLEENAVSYKTVRRECCVIQQSKKRMQCHTAKKRMQRHTAE